MMFRLNYFLVCIFARVQYAAGKCTPDRKIIDLLGILNGTTYDKHKVPELGMKVLIGSRVQAISEVNDQTQDFVLEVFMAESWKDERLAFYEHKPCRNNISLGKDMYEKIWTPNTVFINSKKAYIHSSPFKNIFLMIFDKGYLWTEYRATLTGPCIVQLAAFPIDTQWCELTMLSFSYSTQEVQMRWIDYPIFIEDSARKLADFYVAETNASRMPVPYPAGYWDELTMTFTIQRRYAWYILNVYVPTYLTVFISWISFCLGSKAVPARTMIGVNSLLAMTFQFGSVIRNLPRVSYVKAIDVWMLTGMTFVFSSLLELAVIGWRTHVDDKNKELAEKRRKSDLTSLLVQPIDEKSFRSPIARYRPGSSEFSVGSFRRFRSNGKQSRPSSIWAFSFSCNCGTLEGISVEKIDKFSSVLFPTLFAVFNIFYWSYYLSWVPIKPTNEYIPL